MRLVNDLRIGSKIALIAVVAFLGITAVVWASLSALKEEEIAARKDTTRDMVDVAYGIIARNEADVRAGRLQEQRAKKAVVSELRDLRYGNGGYFWITDTDLHVVLNSLNPEREGKDVSDMADVSGSRIFPNVLQILKQSGSGSYSYYWRESEVGQPVRKLLYVRDFVPWGWIVGTDVSLDDVDSAFRVHAFKVVGIELAIMLLVVVVAVRGTRQVTRPLSKATQSMKELARGDVHAVIADTDRRDEIGDFARALKVFKDAALEKERVERVEEGNITGISTGASDADHASKDVLSEAQVLLERCEFVHALTESFLRRIKRVKDN